MVGQGYGLAKKSRAEHGHEEGLGSCEVMIFLHFHTKKHSQDKKQRWQGVAGNQPRHGLDGHLG